MEQGAWRREPGNAQCLVLSDDLGASLNCLIAANASVLIVLEIAALGIKDE
jgi:hypothetical protein